MPITDDIEIELEVRTTSMGRVLVKNTAGDFDMSAAADGIILCPLSADDTRQLTPGRATINITIRRDGGVSMGATSDIDILRPSSMPSPNNNRLIPMDVVISDAPVEIVLDFIGSEPSLKTINGESLKGEGDINTHLHYATTVDDLPSNVPDGDEGIVSINEDIITEDLISLLGKYGNVLDYQADVLDSNIQAIKFSWLNDQFPKEYWLFIFAPLTTRPARLQVSISGRYVESYAYINGEYVWFNWDISTTDPLKAAAEVQSAIDAIIAAAASQHSFISIGFSNVRLEDYSAIEVTYNRPEGVIKYVRASGEWQQLPQLVETDADRIMRSMCQKNAIFIRTRTDIDGNREREYLTRRDGTILPIVIGNNGYDKTDLHFSIYDENASGYYIGGWQYLLDQGAIPPQIATATLDWIDGGNFQLRLNSWYRDGNGTLYAYYSATPAANNKHIFSAIDIGIVVNRYANPQVQFQSVVVGEELSKSDTGYQGVNLPEFDFAPMVSFTEETEIGNESELKDFFGTLFRANMKLPYGLGVSLPGKSVHLLGWSINLQSVSKVPRSDVILADYNSCYLTKDGYWIYIMVTVRYNIVSDSVEVYGRYSKFEFE